MLTKGVDRPFVSMNFPYQVEDMDLYSYPEVQLQARYEIPNFYLDDFDEHVFDVNDVVELQEVNDEEKDAESTPWYSKAAAPAAVATGEAASGEPGSTATNACSWM